MASCETCHFRRGFSTIPHPREDMPAERVGWCHFAPPVLVTPQQAAWPHVNLGSWCGRYRFSWRAWWRKGKQA